MDRRFSTVVVDFEGLCLPVEEFSFLSNDMEDRLGFTYLCHSCSENHTSMSCYDPEYTSYHMLAY